MEATVSELGPEARSILDAGRAGDDPSPEDRARVRSALRRTLAAGGALAAISAASSTAKGAMGGGALGATSMISVAGKVLAVLALVGVTALGISLRRTRQDPLPSSAVAAEAEGPAAEAKGAGALLPFAIAEAKAPPSIEAAPPPARSKASGAPPAKAPPSVSAAAPPAEDPFAAETRGIRGAHSALQGGDPRRALEMLDEQSAAYENGQLQAERTAARVLVLCKLGRVEEANATAARFLRDNPRSPLLDRIRSGCPAKAQEAER